MDRRSFFKRAALAVPASRLVDSELVASKDKYFQWTYKGYSLKFTGWKGPADQMHLVAQWIAVPIDPKEQERGNDGEPVYIYASDPGNIGFYPRGAVFDISRQVDQYGRYTQERPLMVTSSVAEQNDRKAALLTRMMVFIDQQVHAE
jgi:hypothetical protein